MRSPLSLSTVLDPDSECSVSWPDPHQRAAHIFDVESSDMVLELTVPVDLHLQTSEDLRHIDMVETRRITDRVWRVTERCRNCLGSFTYLTRQNYDLSEQSRPSEVIDL